MQGFELADAAVRVVAARGGGIANALVFLRLPHSDVSLQIPYQRVYDDVRNFVPGRGVEPDVLVVPTVEDLILGRDLALEAAKSLAGTPTPLEKVTGPRSG